MLKSLKQGRFCLLATALFLAVFLLSGCTTLKEKYSEGYGDGYDDATESIDYRSKSYSAGYDEGYTNCKNNVRRQY